MSFLLYNECIFGNGLSWLLLGLAASRALLAISPLYTNAQRPLNQSAGHCRPTPPRWPQYLRRYEKHIPAIANTSMFKSYLSEESVRNTFDPVKQTLPHLTSRHSFLPSRHHSITQKSAWRQPFIDNKDPQASAQKHVKRRLLLTTFSRRCFEGIISSR